MEIEAVAQQCESAPTQEAAAADSRPDIELPGVLRWLRRRRQAVAVSLRLLHGLMPEFFQNTSPTLRAWRALLGVEWVLPALRMVAAQHLQRLPPPLGFRPPPRRGGEPSYVDQHRAGPDPPASNA